ncbi:MAG: response regulator [Candidatus Binatia bacterium]
MDDDDNFRAALAASLRDDGHQVRECNSPRALPPQALLGEVSALVTDYDMPDTDGLTFADGFHAAHPRVPIVLATALSSGILRAQAAARDFLRLHDKLKGYEALHVLLHQLAGRSA